MSSRRVIHNLALIGFMGAGKSSVGRILATQLGFDFVDTDALIEARTGRTVSDIFAQNGEAAFRQIERDLVLELGRHKATVIATGGGLAADAENLARLKETALVVCLWAAPETIWERLRNQTHRPLLQDADPLARIRSLLAVRERYYRQADVLINTDVRPLKEIVQQVLHHFHATQLKPA